MLKPPPPYSCVAPPTVSGYGVDSSASLSGYSHTINNGIDEEDAKSKRRTRVCARSPGSAPPTMVARTRRYKRSSSGVDQARRHHRLQQSYMNASHRQVNSDCHGWACVDSAYAPTGTDYAAAAAACHSAAEVASCRYQTTTGVRPPYRHDLLAVVPSIGPGETGPAAERLKQMAAHYQRLAASADGVDGAQSSSSFGCYDDRYSYELYDEFAAQCQRFAGVQPHYQQQSVYYDTPGYSPMVADTHGYLTATYNGLSQTPTNGSYALAESEAISPSHVTPQFSYSGGLSETVGYSVSDGASRFMTPCAQQTTTLQVSSSLYSSSVASSPSQPTLVSTAIQTPMCFAAEPQRSSVDNFLDVYDPLGSSASTSTSNSTSQIAARRANLTSPSSSFHSASVTSPVSTRSSAWMVAGDSGASSTAWLTGQLGVVMTSPDVGAETAASFCEAAAVPRGLDSAKAAVVVDAELFSRQSTISGIELY